MLFTQFVFPDATPVQVQITLEPEVEAKAKELQEVGWEFQIENNPRTKLVFMDICDAERQLANGLVPNGPEVPKAVQGLVEDAHAAWVAQGKPCAEKAVDDE
jgi:hypothetical protein